MWANWGAEHHAATFRLLWAYKNKNKNEKFDSGMYVEYRVTRKDPESSLSWNTASFVLKAAHPSCPATTRQYEANKAHHIWFIFYFPLQSEWSHKCPAATRSLVHTGSYYPTHSHLLLFIPRLLNKAKHKILTKSITYSPFQNRNFITESNTILRVIFTNESSNPVLFTRAL